MKAIKQISVVVLLMALVNSLWAQSGGKFYKAFEMSVSEGLNLQASAKLGTKPVYGLLGIGTQIFSENYKWAFGAGVGTHLLREDKHSMNLEYMIYHVNEDELWTNNFNNYQQIKILYSWRLAEKISFFAGPTLNLNIAENRNTYGHTFESTFAPYDLYSHENSNHTAKGWIGLTLGVRFDK